MKQPEWQWNEIQQVGTDYTNLEEVEKYDQRMASFRDVDAENRGLLESLNLPTGSSVLEIGCGTGRFIRFAAAAGMKASAADVSKVMLKYVQVKAAEEKLPPIATQNAGFLTMDFPEKSFDAVVSGAALHHLPDMWKFVALRNIFRVLKTGGQFILCDVVFSLKDREDPYQCFEHFINSFNEQIRPGALGHAKQEYSTYDWIMDGLLTRAGFSIETKNPVSADFIIYRCRKL